MNGRFSAKQSPGQLRLMKWGSPALNTWILHIRQCEICWEAIWKRYVGERDFGCLTGEKLCNKWQKERVVSRDE